MKKILLAILSITTISAFAGRGAVLVIDNSTDIDIKIVPINSSCLTHSEDAKITLNPITASNIYLEQDCTLKSGKGELELYDAKSNMKIATTEFFIAKSGTQAGVKTQNNDKFSVRSLSANTFSRTSGTDIIMVRVTPSAQEAAKYSSWMWQMRDQLKDKPLSSIVLPGTHDSLTYDLNTSTLCSTDPDASAFAKAPKFGIAFAKAQYLTMKEQLERGIRYFDIRLCYQSGDSYPSHSLVSNHPFSKDLVQLEEYLKTNPHEIIILDLQHIYGYNEERLKDLLDNIRTRFNGKLISYEKYKPTSLAGDVWHLDNLVESSPNLIVILPNTELVNKISKEPEYSFVWPRSTIHSPWPNVQDIDSLQKKSSANLQNRDTSNFFANQLLLTPDTNYILKNPSYSLAIMAYRDLSSIYSWMWENESGGKLNIVMRDWSNGYDGAIFAMHANNKNQ